MYQYDSYDKDIVQQRSNEFRSQVDRRLSGSLSEDEFKPIRLMNGLYLQLHAYMLRVAIPYGVLSADQLRKLAFIADKYDRGYGHFTTRQNIQFNWPELVDTPDILDHLAQSNMHAIQTSGNCIRNITSDPLAGVAADEQVDPRPICELLRQWSTFHPEFSYLPRKFKFAITGSANDRALIKAHDIGLQLHKNGQGRVVADIWVGGGQGRTPKVAKLAFKDVALQSLLPYLDAIMRVYNQYGRRDNKYKARIKILLEALGLAEFKSRVEAEYNVLDKSRFADAELLLADINSRFVDPQYSDAEVVDKETGSDDAEYQRWLKQNVKANKNPSYAVVLVSLKPIGGIPGDVSSQQMSAIAELVEQYSHNELRITHRQNLVLPHVHRNALYAVWKSLVDIKLAESNIDLPSDIIACPGLDYCALATARSIPIAQSISKKIKASEIKHDLSGVTVNISGCINACAHHHVASIGILGLDRKGTENYQITLGGRATEQVELGERMGPGISADEVPLAVERVVDVYVKNRLENEDFHDTFKRVGKADYKVALYGADNGG